MVRTAYSSDSQTFWVADPFWLQKITTDPHTLAPVNIECKDEGYHWGDPDVDGRVILRWSSGKWEGVETGCSWLRIGTEGRHL